LERSRHSDRPKIFMSQKRIVQKPQAPDFRKIGDENKNDARRRVYWLVGMVFALFAGYQLMQGFTGIVNTSNFIASAKTIQAPVARHESLGRNGNVPVIEFNVDGKSYSARGSYDCGNQCPQVGTMVEIAYDPTSPSTNFINDFANKWLPSILNLVISFIALLGAIVAFLFTRPPVAR
jgi:hypothetical protein